MPCERCFLLAGACIPDVNVIISTCSSDSSTIGTKRHAIDAICVSDECILVCSGVCIPEADGAVTAASSDGISIRVERHTVDPIGMSDKCFLMFSSVCVPQTDSIITAATGNRISIWAERHTVDPILMPYKGSSEDCFVCHIPKIDGMVAAATDECFSIRTEN